ncbi:MAG: RluA family pseudouridine synthase, partial [Oscillospiraceae bacterium]
MDEIKLIAEESDIRIDAYISSKLKNTSRSAVQKLISDNNITVNGKAINKNYKTKLNDEIIINMPEPQILNVKAEDIELDIIYEDSDVAVINKPQGMVVHPAAGHYSGTLVNALMNNVDDLSSINGVLRPGIVHRIDKDTSGLLIVAKNDFAHKALAE